jgi:hypothetical protein
MPDRSPYDAEPFGPAFMQVIVDRLRVRLTQRVSRYVAEEMRLSAGRDPDLLGYFTDGLAVNIETELLTERLPPDVIQHRVKYTHPEAIGRPGVAVDSRFARPIDHFTATYRGRWWGRLLRLHKREIRYTFVKVPYIISAPVECDHRVTATVRAAWTYPQATMVLPGHEYGHVVLKANDVGAESAPWR